MCFYPHDWFSHSNASHNTYENGSDQSRIIGIYKTIRIGERILRSHCEQVRIGRILNPIYNSTIILTHNNY
jgi:hypothetical protein